MLDLNLSEYGGLIINCSATCTLHKGKVEEPAISRKDPTFYKFVERARENVFIALPCATILVW